MEGEGAHSVTPASGEAPLGDADMAPEEQPTVAAPSEAPGAQPDGDVDKGVGSTVHTVEEVKAAEPLDGAALLSDPAKHIASSSCTWWLSEMLLSQGHTPGCVGTVAGVDVVGNAIGSYNILRAFSWQLRLSPFTFDDFASALCMKRSTPLLDEVHMCLLRALYLDDTPEQRVKRSPDPALLDAITWPEFLWQFLQSSGSKLAQIPFVSHAEQPFSESSPARLGVINDAMQEGEAKGEHLEGPRALKAMFANAIKAQHPIIQMDYPSLPAASRVAILMELCDSLISTKAVRQEIDRRASKGFWVAGEGGAGGAFAMFTDEVKALKANAEDNDAIDINSYNDDYCALCGIGGGLLCCDGCPAAYHLRCIGETSKSVPEGEWLCPECAVGGRHEAAGLRVPPAGVNKERHPVFVAHGRLWNAVPDAAQAVSSLVKGKEEPDADMAGGVEGTEERAGGGEAKRHSSLEESEDVSQQSDDEEEEEEEEGGQEEEQLGRGRRKKAKVQVETFIKKGQKEKNSKAKKGMAQLKPMRVKLRSAACELGWLKDQSMQMYMLEGVPAVAASDHIEARHSQNSAVGLFEVDPGQEEMIKGAVAETAGFSDSDYDPDDDLDEISEEDGDFSLEVPDDLHPTSLELLKKHLPSPGNPADYVNRYRNGWVALNAAQKVVLDEAKRAKVAPETLPAPLMISKFVWSNRGRRVPGEGPPSAEQYVEDHSHVRTLAGYLMRLERDLWGLLEGPWAAPGGEGATFRQDWLRRMREATTPGQVKEAALEVVSAVKWSAMHPQWRSAAKVRIADKVGEYKPPTVGEKPVPQVVSSSTMTQAGAGVRTSATPRVPRTAPSRVAPDEDDRDPSQIILSRKRCGKCATCLKPHFKQKCREPILKYADGHLEHMGVVIQEATGVMPKVYKRRKPVTTSADDTQAGEGPAWLQQLVQPVGLTTPGQSLPNGVSTEGQDALMPSGANPNTAGQQVQVHPALPEAPPGNAIQENARTPAPMARHSLVNSTTERPNEGVQAGTSNADENAAATHRPAPQTADVANLTKEGEVAAEQQTFAASNTKFRDGTQNVGTSSHAAAGIHKEEQGPSQPVNAVPSQAAAAEFGGEAPQPMDTDQDTTVSTQPRNGIEVAAMPSQVVATNEGLPRASPASDPVSQTDSNLGRPSDQHVISCKHSGKPTQAAGGDGVAMDAPKQMDVVPSQVIASHPARASEPVATPGQGAAVAGGYGVARDTPQHLDVVQNERLAPHPISAPFQAATLGQVAAAAGGNGVSQVVTYQVGRDPTPLPATTDHPVAMTPSQVAAVSGGILPTTESYQQIVGVQSQRLPTERDHGSLPAAAPAQVPTTVSGGVGPAPTDAMEAQRESQPGSDAQSLATPSQGTAGVGGDGKTTEGHGMTEGMQYSRLSCDSGEDTQPAATPSHVVAGVSDDGAQLNGLPHVDGLQPPRLSPEPEDDFEAARRVREKNRVRMYRYNKTLERLGISPPAHLATPESGAMVKRKRGRPPKYVTPRPKVPRTPSTAPVAKRPRRSFAEPSELRRSGRTPSFVRSESGTMEDGDGDAPENDRDGMGGEYDDGESSEEDEDVAAAFSDLILPSYGRRGRRGAGGYAWRDNKPPVTAGWMVHRNALDRGSGKLALPVAVTKSVARRGGMAPVSGVIYRRAWKGRVLDRAPAYVWISALEGACTVSQIALVLREFDSFILWHDIKRPNPDKEPTHPLRDLVVNGKREAERAAGNEYQILVPTPVVEPPKPPTVEAQPATVNPFEAALAAALPPGTSPLFMNTIMEAFTASQGDPATALQAARLSLLGQTTQLNQPLPPDPAPAIVSTLSIAQTSAPQPAALPTAAALPAVQPYPFSQGVAQAALATPGPALPPAPQPPSAPTPTSIEAQAAAVPAAVLNLPEYALVQNVSAAAPQAAAGPVSSLPAVPPLAGRPERAAAEVQPSAEADAVPMEITPVSTTQVSQQNITESAQALGGVGSAGGESGNCPMVAEATEASPKLMLTYTCGTSSFKIPYGEPMWVHEKRLPLWVVRSYEEVLRRKELTALHRRTRSANAEHGDRPDKRDDATDVCSKCQRAWDETEFDVLWIGCDRCKKWFHGDCVGMTFEKAEELGEDERWDCPACVAVKSAAAVKARERRLATKAARALESGSPSQKSRVTAKPSGAPAEEPVVKAAEVAKQKPAKTDTVDEPREVVEDPPPAGELYCICQAPEDGRPYVGCDGCDGWFHPECMGTTLEEVEELDTFLCVLCARKAARRRKKRAAKPTPAKDDLPPMHKSSGTFAVSTKSEPAAAASAAAAPPVKATDAIRSKWGEEVGATGRKRVAQDWSVLGGGHRKAAAAEKEKEKEMEKDAPGPLSDRDVKKQIGCAMAVITAIIKLKGAGPFRKPVPADMPFYFDVIKHPMDLGTVYKQIKTGHYRSAFQVLKDVRLVWANCRAYNQPDSGICAAADRLENCVEELWAKWALPTEEHPDILRAMRKERDAAKRELEREAKRVKEEERQKEAQKKLKAASKALRKAAAKTSGGEVSKQVKPTSEPADSLLSPTRRSVRAAGAHPAPGSASDEAAAVSSRGKGGGTADVPDAGETRKSGKKWMAGEGTVGEVKQEAVIVPRQPRTTKSRPRSTKSAVDASASHPPPAAATAPVAVAPEGNSSPKADPKEEVGAVEESPIEPQSQRTAASPPAADGDAPFADATPKGRSSRRAALKDKAEAKEEPRSQPQSKRKAVRPPPPTSPPVPVSATPKDKFSRKAALKDEVEEKGRVQAPRTEQHSKRKGSLHRQEEEEAGPSSVATPKREAKKVVTGGAARSAPKSSTGKAVVAGTLASPELTSEPPLFTNTGRPLRRARIDEVMHDSPNKPSREPKPPPVVKVGTAIEADWDNQGEYYPGKVTLVHRSGAVSILYDDGDTEVKVPMSRVRLLSEPHPQSDEPEDGATGVDKQQTSPAAATPSRRKRSRR